MTRQLMFKRTILAVAIATLPLSGVALAQESATITMRSGDKVSGELMDLGGVGFTVKVNGTERQIPTNDVAVIDFGGSSMTDADWSKVPGDRPTVLMKNGEAISGRLVDIGGSSPLRLSLRTRSGDRDVSSNEVSHIILARPSNAPAASGQSSGANLAPATGSASTVSPKQAWTATGITVRKGEVNNVNATGEVQLSGDSNDVATPFGSKSGRKAANAPLPNVLAGALIGKIGSNGAPFAVGSGVSIPMPEAGQLFLGVNDDGFDDNRGEFRVEMVRTNQRR